MTPEENARQEIDAMLTASGWVVQTRDKINLSAARGVTVCELSFAAGEPDWTDDGQHADILHQLAERGIDFPSAAAHSRKFNHGATPFFQPNSWPTR